MGYECEDDHGCEGGISLAEQHPRTGFSLHLDVSGCSKTESEEYCKKAMIALDGEHDCMKDGQCHTGRLSKRRAQYYPDADFYKHYYIATGINENNGGERFATVMEHRMISDEWLAGDSEPNVNTVTHAHTPASSKQVHTGSQWSA